MPKISVIIPVYNVENYLRKCLNSISSQTLNDIEIICVDDCSSDNSLSILKDYAHKDSRFIITENKKNMNAAESRNIGMKVAKGEYLSFIDSDDYIDDDFYEKLYALTIQNSADIVKGNVRIVNINNSIEYMNNNHSIRNNKMCFLGGWWSAIYKNEFIKNNSIIFPKECFKAQDIVFLNRCLINTNKIIIADDTFYNYRRREQSLDIGWLDDKKLLSSLKAYNMIFTELNSCRNKLSTEEFFYAYGQRLNGVLSLFYRIKKKKMKLMVLVACINNYFECNTREKLANYCYLFFWDNIINNMTIGNCYDFLEQFENYDLFIKKSTLYKLKKRIGKNNYG